ncbi:MAG: helix-turn-helix domain-containing protein [Hyphomonas sp.]
MKLAEKLEMAKRPTSRKPKAAGGEESQPVAPIQYPRRTERRRRTRAKILEKAASLFGESGYGPATMQAIADAADVHVTTLFLHFKSKGELALSLVEASLDELRKRAGEARGNVPVFDFLRKEARERARRLAGRKGRLPSLWQALYTDNELAFARIEYERGQHDLIAEYVATEYGFDRRVDIRPEIVASLLLAAAFLPHLKWDGAGGVESLEGAVQESFDIGERAARHILEAVS